MLTEVEPRKGLYLHALEPSRSALLPVAHPWAGSVEALPLAELDKQMMVLREPGSITRRSFDQACAGASVQPRVVARPISDPGLVNRHMLGCLERRRELRLIQAFLGLAPQP